MVKNNTSGTVRSRIALILALFFIPFLFFWPVVFPFFDSPATFASGDFLRQYYPNRVFVAREYWDGRIPLWNPYVSGGHPAIADPQYSTFYPPTFFTIILGGRDGPTISQLELEVLAHLGLASIFTYFFVRRLLHSETPAIFAGLAFSLGGYFTSWPLSSITILETSVWLPLILLLLDLGIDKGTRHYLLAGLVLALSFLAGHPQPFIYTVYAAIAFWLLRTLLRRPDGRQSLGHTLGLVLCLAVAAGVAAVQLLPTLEILPQSSHLQYSAEVKSQGIAWEELVAIFIPGGSAGNSALYVGYMSLILGVVAIVLGKPTERIFWLGMAAISLLLSLGGKTPLYSIVSDFVPGFDIIRNQERILFLWGFATAIFAAYGLHAVLTKWPKLAKTVSFVIIPLLGIELYLANGATGVVARVSEPYPPLAATRFIQADPATPFRITSEGLLPSDGNAAAIYQLEDIIGFSSLTRQEDIDFWADIKEEWVKWDLYNVKYVLTRRYFQREGISLDHQESDLYLYRLTDPMPRAHFVFKAEVAERWRRGVRIMNSPDFDLRKTVVLDRPPPLALPQSPPFETNLAIFEYQAGLLAIETQAPTNALLVLSQRFDPGWRAEVDGQEVSILRANLLFQAIPLPSGYHLERVWFDPPLFRVGLAISLITLLSTIGIIVTLSRKAAKRHA